MQTFITDFNLQQSAKNLDNRRLGKQRIEALQILFCLLKIKPVKVEGFNPDSFIDFVINTSNKWKDHPAVRMWRGYEDFLLFYIYVIMTEWCSKGFKNTKCIIYFRKLKDMISINQFNKPLWITEDFIESHRSNLIRKNYEYYKPLFPNTKEGLPYIWPV